MLFLDEPALTGVAAQMVTHGMESTAETAAALGPAAAIVPAGADIVSPLAAAGFAQYAAEQTVNDTLAHAQATIAGTVLGEIVVAYNAADAAGAAGLA
jgi:hypothetical protein